MNFGCRSLRALLVCLPLLAGSAPALASYTFSVLDVPAIYDLSSASKINNAGQIIGAANHSLSDSRSVAVLWNHGQYINMTAAAGMDGQLQTLRLSDINNHGTVLGWATTAPCDTGCAGTTRAIKWESGNFADAPGANAINDAGTIADSGTGTLRLWNNGSFTTLPTAGGYQRSQANDINNAGLVVGTSSRDAGTIRSAATVWQNGNVELLSNPYNRNSFANAVNEAGRVVGYTTFTRFAPFDGPNGQYYAMQRAALWEDGAFFYLDAFSSTHNTVAAGINEAGAIVGHSYDKDGLNHQATLWLDGVITNLNTFLSAQDKADGWQLTHAYDINDRGWIVGDAYNSITGATRAFLLASAVPEPGSYLMMLAGLGMLVGALRRTGKTDAAG